jgi:glyoxylase-like metal-dependent hydrolase (beta-lactamase superfamily II)
MEILRIDSFVTAFIRPDEGANVGLIHTPNGMVLIDTTSSPTDIQALFRTAGVRAEEVRVVINTHSHSDHTWGNQLFTCPILAHRLCQEQMQSNLKSEWSSEALKFYLTDLEKTDSKKAEDFRRVVKDLQIKLPDQVFEERFKGELAGMKYEIIHLGGHTPDLSVVWLPEKKVLFASDLIFQGRYPYIFDADIPAWITALSRLLEFDAAMIIPGHGVRCVEAEIIALREYLQDTWELTSQHIRLRHNADETSTDPAYPRFAEKLYERLHQANIRHMYKQQTK